MDLSIKLTKRIDAAGKVSKNGVILTQTPCLDGRAVLLCATAEKPAKGFDRDRAVLLFPDLPAGAPWLAIENHSSFWCRPAWGDKPADLPEVVEEAVFRREDDYLVILALCGDTFKTALTGTPEGAALRLYAGVTDAECREQPVCVALAGGEPYSLMLDAARAAAEVLHLPMRQDKRAHDLFNTLGWCSWDAMQIRVNEAGMLEKAAEFKTKNVPVQYAIFDDMWADVPRLNAIPRDATYRDMVEEMHKSKMRRFEGDPVRFPHGMKAAVEALHAAGIPHAGIWFPTTGYWSGMEPGGEADEWQKDNLITTGDGWRVVAPDKEKAAAYFRALCEKAREWGADLVKIDNQGFHWRYRDIAPVGQSARAIQSAIDAATDDLFDGALINCMGMASECMFNRRSTVSRCSDDFKPESREWFAKNVLQCAFNGLLQGQFYVNDWDMWWTDDEQAKRNSVCRAISGGPVYVSDKIGRTRPEILSPVVLKNGRILRPDESATPTADCLMQNPTVGDRIFKIRNRVGQNALVAAFNINAENGPVSGFVSPENAGLPRGEYAYREFFTNEAGILAPGQVISVDLIDRDAFRLYTFAPLVCGVAVFGRADLYVGVGAVTQREKGCVTVCEKGPVGFVSTRPLTFADENGDPLPAERRGLLSLVTGETICYR